MRTILSDLCWIATATIAAIVGAATCLLLKSYSVETLSISCVSGMMITPSAALFVIARRYKASMALSLLIYGGPILIIEDMLLWSALTLIRSGGGDDGGQMHWLLGFTYISSGVSAGLLLAIAFKGKT